MDKRRKDTLRLNFDRKLKVEFNRAKAVSDTGMISLIMRFGLLLYIFAFHGMAAFGAESAKLGLSVEQITFGPNSHFFGYIGQSKTIPWNADGRYILALRVGFYDRMPKPDDAADVVLIDRRIQFVIEYRPMAVNQRFTHFRSDQTPVIPRVGGLRSEQKCRPVLRFQIIL